MGGNKNVTTKTQRHEGKAKGFVSLGLSINNFPTYWFFSVEELT